MLLGMLVKTVFNRLGKFRSFVILGVRWAKDELEILLRPHQGSELVCGSVELQAPAMTGKRSDDLSLYRCGV